MPAINHHLRLLVSYRRFTAQVTNQSTDSIVALASSTEQEFAAQLRTKLNRFTRDYYCWDAKTAALLGDKLGFRLKEIGISSVEIDAADELSRPVIQRKMVSPFFESVKRAGITVAGSEKLDFISTRVVRMKSRADFHREN